MDEDLDKDFYDAFIRLSHLAVKYDESMEFHEDLLEEPAEIDLYRAFKGVDEKMNTQVEAGNYREKLLLLKELTPKIHKYFDDVMILVEDERLRNNRLAMLHGIDQTLGEIFDVNALVLE